jgi:hypothetical protein
MISGCLFGENYQKPTANASREKTNGMTNAREKGK